MYTRMVWGYTAQRKEEGGSESNGYSSCTGMQSNQQDAVAPTDREGMAPLP